MSAATFDDNPRNHPGYAALLDAIFSDRCWDCDEVKAEGKCPDCNDPGEWCSKCLREHQRLEHGADS